MDDNYPEGSEGEAMILIKSKEDIDIMRRNGKLLDEIHEIIGTEIYPGVKAIDLDKIVEKWIKSEGATPSFKGYRGFPASICVSMGCELIHGPPAGQILHEGQIVSIDIGLYKDGFHVDAARTWPVGKIHYGMEHLIQSVRGILRGTCELIRPGVHLSDLSSGIQLSAESRGLEVVRGYGGHGIGRNLHEDPHIPNYGFKGTGPILKEGMVLALEPMIMMGNPEVEVLYDGWTVISKDRKPNAHAEDTVVVTKDGCETLTRM